MERLQPRFGSDAIAQKLEGFKPMSSRFIHRLLVPVLALTLAFGGAFSAMAVDQGGDELSKAIAQLNAEQKAALLVLVNGIVKAKVPAESPAEGAMKTVNAYVKAAETADVDGMMACFSENFDHYELGNKAGMRAFLEGAEAEGMLEDMTGNVEEAEADIDGDTVTIYPVELEGLFGTATCELELKAEGGVWKIVGFDMTGV
ncbi:MAG: hypothetical protein L3K26_16040 [Candidatus Hydrogenedentes bacterium]|nr:hypothetical protein [Candidatus Hydrogenedentota bacterium]